MDKEDERMVKEREILKHAGFTNMYPDHRLYATNAKQSGCISRAGLATKFAMSSLGRRRTVRRKPLSLKDLP